MTKFGETQHFTARDFVIRLEAHLGRQVDGLIGNTTRPPQTILDAYALQKSHPVKIDTSHPFWSDREIILTDILDDTAGIVRHDSLKLARVIEKII